jgi:hypothetical protein
MSPSNGFCLAALVDCRPYLSRVTVPADSFLAYRFTFNKYGSLIEDQVLAYNLFLCETGVSPRGNAPF